MAHLNTKTNRKFSDEQHLNALRKFKAIHEGVRPDYSKPESQRMKRAKAKGNGFGN